MNRSLRALALSAAASALMLGSSFAGDFIETIAAQAPLAGPEAAPECEKAAQAQLSEPLAALKKRCSEASGQFNVGLVTPSIHRKSCSVYQTVTCSATDGPQEAAAEPPASSADAAPKPAEKLTPGAGTKSQPKRKRRKLKPGERQAQSASPEPKGK